MKRARIFLITALSILTASCSPSVTDGVSKELAESRKAAIADVRYEIRFDIPREKSEPVAAGETVRFSVAQKQDVVLDARGFEVSAVTVNGTSMTPDMRNEHLIVPKRLIESGENAVEIEFTAGEQSLNRRDKFLYTLLVPDRARTLFPCFDQPDMKSKYALTLTVPEGWTAVSNTSVESREGNTIRFAETEPLSTYLFSFVAGEFECVSVEGIEASGKPIHLYHRETDPAKIAECGEVLRLVRSSIDWLEEYTGSDYPFGKYDLIVLPDFQYGGMEHTGATLYNDRRIFLSANATTEEILDRAQLIAHETAHMWFGDCVTMRWFNDVWTKEVFANFFAAKMVRPLYPGINHEIADLKSYYAPAYTEDRTIGSNAIQRNLDNLNNAGLIYCNIIYDKSPVVMGMLEQRLGPEAFRKGIQEYVRKFAYANATWDELIEIFSQEADFDVAEWSRVWIKEKGMPEYTAEIAGNEVTVTQKDPFGAGNIWQQNITYTLVGAEGECTAEAVFDGGAVARMAAPFEVAYVIPNSDGKAYGRFVVDEKEALSLKKAYSGISDETGRLSVLMTLYENLWHKSIDAAKFAEWICYILDSEKNTLIQSSLLSYGAAAARWCGGSELFEDTLFQIASDASRSSELRLLAFRTLMPLTTKYSKFLFMTWADDKPFNGLELSESDRTSLAYQLMVRYPEGATDIRRIQEEKITNPDRKESFLYISQACAAEREERDAFFESLLHAETRSAESRVTTALSLLNHPLRQEDAVRYITPGLEAIEEVQRTGDIFFPSTWSNALLSNHLSPEAAQAVSDFVRAHEKSMNPLLMTKVLQKGGWLLQ